MDATLPRLTPVDDRRDAALVARVRAGDQAAFAAIVTEHTPRLLAHARRIVGGHHDAEDVVQEAFVNAHRALLRDERDVQLAAWLHAIVRNRALDRLRQARPQAPLDTAILRIPAARTREPDQALEQREALDAVLAGIRALPERQRSALVQHELEGLPHAVIARRLGVSEAGSKTLLHRARAGVRAHAAAA